MKRFLILLKLEYDGMFLPLCAIIGLMSVLQLGLFGRRLRATGGHMPLAYLIDVGGIPIAFAIGFICLLALIWVRLTMNYTTSKSMYALLALPVKRGYVYLAKLAASLLGGFMLLAAQMALLMVFNAIAGMRAVSTHDEFEIARRQGDLYLTLLDSNFLRMLFPPDLYSLAFSMFAFAGSISIMLYLAAMSRARKWLYAALLATAWLVLLLVTFPLTDYTWTVNVFKLLLLIIVPFVAGVKGIRLFVNGEVTG
ncbi:MAG: hypothetical protein FWC77_08450 [Defluviitaleaceae bacterium]|nr:hypothetical protein [Defluviitaleaceae bacterium]